MKLLSLLRHAKTGLEGGIEVDFDRPLNERGVRAAKRMGEWARDDGLAFDRVLASPALRIRQTVKGIEEGLGANIAPRFDRRLYLAHVETLLDLLQQTPDGVQHLLVIGHNPGLEELLLALTPADGSAFRLAAEQKYPTASYARVRLPIASWKEAGKSGTGVIERFIRPRDLDPTLGPDC